MRSIFAAIFVALLAIVGSAGAQADRPYPSSAVMVEVPGGMGSGFYIGDDVVITAAHVINGVEPRHGVLVSTSRNDLPADFLGAGILWKSGNLDVAALKLSNVPDDMNSAKLACREPIVGEQVEVVGNPLGQEFLHTWGRVSGVTRTDSDDDAIITPIDVMVSSGNSGGPVYDAKGEVIGLADRVIDAAKSKYGVGHVNFMVPSMVVCKLLEIAKHQGL